MSAWTFDIDVTDFASTTLEDDIGAELVKRLPSADAPAEQQPPEDDLDVMQALITQAKRLAQSSKLSGSGSVGLVRTRKGDAMVSLLTSDAAHGQNLDAGALELARIARLALIRPRKVVVSPPPIPAMRPTAPPALSTPAAAAASPYAGAPPGSVGAPPSAPQPRSPIRPPPSLQKKRN